MSIKCAFFSVFQKLVVFCCAIFFGFSNAFSANLPAGYTELEYIESTGTQYIDTGVIVTNGQTLSGSTIDFQALTLESNNSSVIAGAVATSGDGPYSNNQVLVYSNAFFKQNSASTSSGFDFSQNDATKRTVATCNGEGIAAPGISFLLFARNRTALGPQIIGTQRIYSAKLYDNGTLVRNMVPAKNSSGVVGMYDTVNGVFYQNAGSGAFTAGPVVLDPCRNLFDKDAMIHGAYIGASGTETYSAQYCYSNYIPVTPGQTYTFSAVRNQSASNKRIHAYDSNKNWIQQLGLSPSSSSVGPYDITVTIPSGISYILISGMKCDVDVADTNMQFEQGSTATTYVPYNANCHNTNGIKIATTAYNAARFSPVVNDLNTTIATIRDIVTNTINQTAAIASLQADKQTRPEDACPAGKKCLLVETEENGVIVPHWYEIIENIYGLPAGYTALEYIQSDGNSWIDTGIKGNMSYKYDIEFQQLDAGQYRNWGAFNQQSYSGGPNMSLTYAYGFAVRWTVTGNNQQVVDGLSSLDANRHHLVIDNGNITWDGVSKGRSTGHQNNYQLNYNLFLGTINPGGTTPTANAKSKYYSYKVWNTDGNLIQNFVPAKNSSGVIGMYDTVNDVFYTNQGTGTFTAGPEM